MKEKIVQLGYKGTVEISELLETIRETCWQQGYALRETVKPHHCRDSRMDSLILLAQAIKDGFDEDPGTSDLADEQPINVRMTLGEYRRAKRVMQEIEG